MNMRSIAPFGWGGSMLPGRTANDDPFVRLWHEVDQLFSNLVRGAGPAEWPRTTEAGTLRMAAAFWTEPSSRGACLRTETRVDGRGRLTWLVFRLYWLVVAPFSSLIRRRWLRAAATRIPAAT